MDGFVLDARWAAGGAWLHGRLVGDLLAPLAALDPAGELAARARGFGLGDTIDVSVGGWSATFDLDAAAPRIVVGVEGAAIGATVRDDGAAWIATWVERFAAAGVRFV